MGHVMKNEDLALIVLSCDRFASLWPLFFNRLSKYFPQNFANIYLLTNFLSFEQHIDHNIEVFDVGEDISWSSNLRKILDAIDEQNILIMMDDAPLAKCLDRRDLQNYYDLFQKKEMNYLNLKASPLPNCNIEDAVGMLRPKTGYRAAVVPCLWKKSILLELLRDEESAWEFEINGSNRSDDYPGFYSVRSPVIIFDHIIIKGKIERRVYSKLTKLGEETGLMFPVMSISESIFHNMRIFFSKYLNLIVPTKILAFLRKIRYGG